MTKDGEQEIKEHSGTAKESEGNFSESVMKLVETLDQYDWRTEYEHSEDSVKRSQQFLAEQYFEISKIVIVSLISLSLSLVLTDILFPISSFLYGLTISIWGSILLAVPSLKGRYQISAIVDSNDKSAIRRVEAKRMTYTNAGLGFLILGFFIQLVTHQINANNIIADDVLAIYFPDWVAILALIAIFLLVVRTIDLLAESISG
ncbi:hypothetical protein [Halorubrum sp. SD626R]|uniref:hypothetical protein n=1 Tax=Halorubrum sp. SD626R TaxID=1419722 RepID=UPI0010F7210B|nr:hypothetical protein [Halorubrum sp. SD626R]TKX79878.1 hypothetical protein EXE53_13800 [Halorubrum sp. SD626R]